MHPFRRLGLTKRKQRTRTPGPTIASTAIVALSAVAALPRSVRSSIGSDEQTVCLVHIESPERRYTLVLDLDWVAMAVEVGKRSSEFTDDLPLPRAAIRAVINDWSVNQRFDDSAVRWSKDRIPHVGYPLLDDIE